MRLPYSTAYGVGTSTSLYSAFAGRVDVALACCLQGVLLCRSSPALRTAVPCRL
jgi:hypothetical protein